MGVAFCLFCSFVVVVFFYVFFFFVSFCKNMNMLIYRINNVYSFFCFCFFCFFFVVVFSVVFFRCCFFLFCFFFLLLLLLSVKNLNMLKVKEYTVSRVLLLQSLELP